MTLPRGPICVAKDRNTTDAMDHRVFYLRRPWKRLATLTVFKRWDCIIFGATTGIEVNIGKLHIELQRREGNA
jgi:hypothetical protein